MAGMGPTILFSIFESLDFIEQYLQLFDHISGKLGFPFYWNFDLLTAITSEFRFTIL